MAEMFRRLQPFLPIICNSLGCFKQESRNDHLLSSNLVTALNRGWASIHDSRLMLRTQRNTLHRSLPWLFTVRVGTRDCTTSGTASVRRNLGHELQLFTQRSIQSSPQGFEACIKSAPVWEIQNYSAACQYLLGPSSYLITSDCACSMCV